MEYIGQEIPFDTVSGFSGQFVFGPTRIDISTGDITNETGVGLITGFILEGSGSGTGFSGTSGTSGFSSTGTSGFSGTSGTYGASGFSGAGFSGTSGFSGSEINIFINIRRSWFGL